jgi:hypothetical protein
MKQRKVQPPSRVRYAADHPTIGVHIPTATYEKLLELRKRSGMSFGQLVLQALGVVEMDIAEVEANAFERGRRSGYAAARSVYRLTAPCCVCLEPMEVEPGSDLAKAAVAAVVHWGHEACPSRSARVDRGGGA